LESSRQLYERLYIHETLVDLTQTLGNVWANAVGRRQLRWCRRQLQRAECRLETVGRMAQEVERMLGQAAVDNEIAVGMGTRIEGVHQMWDEARRYVEEVDAQNTRWVYSREADGVPWRRPTVGRGEGTSCGEERKPLSEKRQGTAESVSEWEEDFLVDSIESE